MKKQMRWTGPAPAVIPGIGEVRPGETYEVDERMAEGLREHPYAELGEQRAGGAGKPKPKEKSE